MSSFDPQFWEFQWGWIVIIPILVLIAIVWAVVKIRKRFRRQDFRKCTDAFLEERYIRGELMKKNVPKRVFDK